MGRKARKKNPNYFFLEDDQIPPFKNFEAVFSIFSPEVFIESTEEKAPLDEPKTKDIADPNLQSPAFEERIIQLAQQGLTIEIIELTRARIQPRKLGRPKMTSAEKWRSNPNHQAALIYQQAKDMLEDIYPKQRIEEINEYALMITEKVWNAVAERGKKVDIDTLRTHIRRPKRSGRWIDES
jgi:hypothetical protein